MSHYVVITKILSNGKKKRCRYRNKDQPLKPPEKNCIKQSDV